MVEGRGLLTVVDTQGQIVLTKEIKGKEELDLPQGLFFVKLGGETKKIVVE